MKIFTNNLAWWHLKSFLWIYVIFTVAIAYISYMGITEQGGTHTRLVIQTTAGSITGPMIGAISRDFQGCCLRFSLSVMKIAAPVLLFGIILQFVQSRDKRWVKGSIRGVWIISWILWFLLGIATFGHALV